jgi:hypothetical protein
MKGTASRSLQNRYVPGFFDCFEDLFHRTLSHWAGDHAGMAETTAARAAAHDLDWSAVVHGVHIGNDKACEGRWQDRNDALGDGQGGIFDQLFDAAEGAIFVIMSLVERRHVNARNARQCSSSNSRREDLLVAFSPGLVYVNDIQDGFFPLTDYERIYKGVHWLRVEGGMTTGDHQGMLCVAFSWQTTGFPLDPGHSMCLCTAFRRARKNR